MPIGLLISGGLYLLVGIIAAYNSKPRDRTAGALHEAGPNQRWNEVQDIYCEADCGWALTRKVEDISPDGGDHTGEGARTRIQP